MGRRAKDIAGTGGDVDNGASGNGSSVDGANGNITDSNPAVTGGDDDRGNGIQSPTGSGTAAGDAPGTTGPASSGDAAGPARSTLGTEKPRRGRKPGSTNGAKTAPLDLTEEIVGAHWFLAGVFGCPELLMEDDEAVKLSKSLQRFSKEYEVKVNTKVVAMVGLIATAAGVYIPRGFAIAARIKATKAKAAQERVNKERPIVITPEGVNMGTGTEPLEA